MTLIVAIEPDRRQANYLSAMVRGRLKAELVLGESAEDALSALGNRVPDVILTSALLSPKDEGVLAEWLRTLDAAAAHVQTLTIPVFSGSRARPQRVRGMLAALMGSADDEGASAPDGCDPAMFADQCADYLERARAERASRGGLQEDEEAEEMVDAMNADMQRPFEMAAAEPAQNEFVEFDLSQMLNAAAEQQPSETPSPDDQADVRHRAGDPPPPAPETDIWVPPRLGVERLWPSMEIPDSAASRSAMSAPQPPARRVPRNRRPVQDEWGFFDPDQCGFAALLAKLAEITDGDDPPAKRPA